MGDYADEEKDINHFYLSKPFTPFQIDQLREEKALESLIQHADRFSVVPDELKDELDSFLTQLSNLLDFYYEQRNQEYSSQLFYTKDGLKACNAARQQFLSYLSKLSHPLQAHLKQMPVSLLETATQRTRSLRLGDLVSGDSSFDLVETQVLFWHFLASYSSEKKVNVPPLLMGSLQNYMFGSIPSDGHRLEIERGFVPNLFGHPAGPSYVPSVFTGPIGPPLPRGC